jgi:predicted nucleic acid-binding protein
MIDCVVLDAGALIAVERGTPLIRRYLLLADQGVLTVVTSSAVVAQVWRGGARQARLARLLRSDLVEEVWLDRETSRRIGALAGSTGGIDVVDGHVALIAQERDAVVLTSDPHDLAKWGLARQRIVRC